MEQHKAQVTAAWNRRDTPRAFVRSLEDMGYILATGNRDYVLVDRYGNMNSLPKLIDDKKVRIKQVREFLGKDFPKDSLPTVDEARALAAGASRGDGAVQQRRGTGRTGGQRESSAGRSCSANSRPRAPGRGAGGEGAGRPAAPGPAQNSERQKAGSIGVPAGVFAGEPAHQARPRRAPAEGACRLHRPHYRRRADNEEDSPVPGRHPVQAFLAQKKELAERQQREAAAFDASAGSWKR